MTAAALALPGMAKAQEEPAFNIQYGHYEEGKRDLDGQSYKDLKLEPLKVDSFSIQGVVPVGDRLKIKGEFTQDSWSGATPVVTVPGAAVQAQLLSGASSPNFFHIDRHGTPYVVDYSDYDPATDTYGHTAHPGLVHVMASASPETRRQLDGSATYEWDRAEISLGGGISDEHDYLSHFFNVGGKFDFNNKLTVLNWGASAARNRIRASIAANSAADTGNYADRIRIYNGQPTIFGTRKDISANVGVTQILNESALIQADISYTRSSGFLENPYKAVVFAFNDPREPFDNMGLKYIPTKGSLEQRPDLRDKWSANVRFAQHLRRGDGALHLNYRYYRDDWGIRSHTFEASLDQPLPGGWMITPDVRYYSQTAADFYAPYFMFHEAFPAHPGGPLDRSKIPLKYFSSDARLSAFGALSGSVTLQKSLSHGIALDLSYEYYSHKGSLKLGGGGEPAYADFTSSLVSAGLKIDLARRQDELRSGVSDGAPDRLDPIIGIRPPGLLMPEILRPGAMVLSAQFVGESWKGPVELHGRAVENDELAANACGDVTCKLEPIGAGRNVVKFDVSYALRPWATLTFSPTYVERSMTLTDVFSFFPPFPLLPLPHLGGPTGSGPHSSSSWGDTSLLASFELTPGIENPHARIAVGISAPTGQAGRRLNSKTDFVGYSLQTGSGTWDALAGMSFDGAWGRFRAGGELSGTKRLGTNDFGYRLGDQARADLWAGADVMPWLTLMARLKADHEGSIHGQYADHFEKNVPFTELQQVDYDVNGDGAVDSRDVDYVTVYRDALVPHVVASPDDLPANHGGTFVDAGLGLTLHALSGPFKGDRVSVEWLAPVRTIAKGYQLRPGTVVSAKTSIAL